MHGHWRGTVRLLTCLLLLQWAAAVLPHARAMAQLASAQVTEICGHDGIRRILVGEDGQPVQPEQASSCCDLGCAPSVLPLDDPAPLAVPASYVLVVEPCRREGLPSSPPRAPPQQPRAPPVS